MEQVSKKVKKYHKSYFLDLLDENESLQFFRKFHNKKNVEKLIITSSNLTLSNTYLSHFTNLTKLCIGAYSSFTFLSYLLPIKLNKLRFLHLAGAENIYSLPNNLLNWKNLKKLWIEWKRQKHSKQFYSEHTNDTLELLNNLNDMFKDHNALRSVLLQFIACKKCTQFPKDLRVLLSKYIWNDREIGQALKDTFRF